MQFSEPISALSPGLHGRVLTVLARTDQPLTGRATAALLRRPRSTTGVQNVLDDLVRSGLVKAEPAGRARLYTINRQHLAHPAIWELVNLRESFLARLRTDIQSWKLPALAVWWFGSTARGEGGPDSDIDLLVLRAEGADDSDPRWLRQLDELTEQVKDWTGNSCEILELSAPEVAELIRRGDRLVTELRDDAIPVAGAAPRLILHRKAST
jgi:predicted nucleotidyltransferase